jgi:hypothetical protein
MKKTPLKFIIDLTLYVDVCSIAILGLMLGFVIPRGARGGSFLGLYRHQWGDIHLFLSLVLILLLVLHLWMNWNWIEQSSKRYFGPNWKNMLWMLSGAWFFVLLVAWAVAKF